MGLRDYVVPSENVRIDEANDFDVRGISVEDISRLVHAHGPVFVMLYQRLTDERSKGDITPETLGMLLQSAIMEFPETIGDLIACAADTPDLGATVKKLPAPVQIDAVEKIIGLTFRGESTVKKLVEIVTRMMQRVTDAMAEVNGPIASGSGGGAFAGK